MTGKGKYFIIVIVVLLTAYILVLHYSPKPLNWEFNCDSDNKSPYGCLVLNQMLPQIFPGKQIDKNHLSFYQLLGSDTVHNNIIVVTNVFEPAVTDLEAMLGYVSEGNNIFISALGFSEAFGDTLGFSVKTILFDTAAFGSGKTRLHFTEEHVDTDSGYVFNRNLTNGYFTRIDTTNTRILGTDQSGRPDFISVDFNRGRFFLHCHPLVFTNYHLLNSNYEYACTALSYLPVENTIWDQYYKPFKYVDLSPVRYILSQPSLKMGYYLIMIAILVYLLIGSKRKQRTIPVIVPPKNESLLFIYTMGRLYFNRQNHTDLARKIVTYLKDFIRRRYMIQINEEDGRTYTLLASKSLVPGEQIEKMFTMAKTVLSTDHISKESLLEFYKLTEDFYNRCS